jgi:ribonuclease P/MRP protein subunit RPP40
MIEVFKILKGFEEVDYSKFFTLATDNRRGHSLKLYKTWFKNNLGKFAFSNRVVDTSNDLPEVVSCKAVNN